MTNSNDQPMTEAFTTLTMQDFQDDDVLRDYSMICTGPDLGMSIIVTEDIGFHFLRNEQKFIFKFYHTKIRPGPMSSINHVEQLKSWLNDCIFFVPNPNQALLFMCKAHPIHWAKYSLACGRRFHDLVLGFDHDLTEFSPMKAAVVNITKALNNADDETRQ